MPITLDMPRNKMQMISGQSCYALTLGCDNGEMLGLTLFFMYFIKWLSCDVPTYLYAFFSLASSTSFLK